MLHTDSQMLYWFGNKPTFPYCSAAHIQTGTYLGLQSSSFRKWPFLVLVKATPTHHQICLLAHVGHNMTTTSFGLGVACHEILYHWRLSWESTPWLTARKYCQLNHQGFQKEWLLKLWNKMENTKAHHMKNSNDLFYLGTSIPLHYPKPFTERDNIKQTTTIKQLD